MISEHHVEVGLLNIVATPHPTGVYERLLRQAAGKQIAFFGDQVGAISAPVPVENESNLLQGRLVVWTEIDENEPGINKPKLSEVSLSDMNFKVPRDLGFNGRVFYYVFNVSAHVMALEIKNDFGKTISPGRAKRFLDRLLSPLVLGIDAENVEVTVIPEDDALARVLGLPRLDKVEILVKRPNDDDITAETNAVMAELIAQKAKSEERTLVRAPGADGLELSEENMIRARVAATNGYVSSSGRDEDDDPDTRSTKEYPKVLTWIVNAGETFYSYVRKAARDANARPG